MKRDVKFEKDAFLLISRVLLIFIFFGLITIILFTLFVKDKNIVNWILIFLTATVLTILSLFFFTHSVEIYKNELILKNIYGIKINNLNLNKSYSRKITLKNNYTEAGILFGLFGGKYKRIINIKFKLKKEKKKFSLNGQILTLKGYNELVRKTKREKNIKNNRPIF